jgi:hypothetical protein
MCTDVHVGICKGRARVFRRCVSDNLLPHMLQVVMLGVDSCDAACNICVCSPSSGSRLAWAAGQRMATGCLALRAMLPTFTGLPQHSTHAMTLTGHSCLALDGVSVVVLGGEGGGKSGSGGNGSACCCCSCWLQGQVQSGVDSGVQTVHLLLHPCVHLEGCCNQLRR